MWGFLKKVFKSDYDKETEDARYQKLLKKYDIEAIDWAGTDSSEEYARKLEKSRRKETEQKKRVKQDERKVKAKKKTKFIEKYGKELGTKIAKGELWIGMSKEALMAIKGKPGKKNETISRNKKREEYFFDGYKNRQGNMSFKLKVILIDGLVEKWAIG